MRMGDPEYAIGVDIGGTKINAGLIGRLGEVLFEASVPTRAAESKVMEQTKSAIDRVLQAARSEQAFHRIAGIGVGSAGQIDFSRGTVLSATDLLPDYAGTDVRGLLETAYGVQVYVDNDVNVLALAEKRLGAGRYAEHFVCVALGTGVGGAIVSEGRLLRGALGAAGEIGHMPVRFDGPICNCGGRGCLELFASGTGIARLMRDKVAQAAKGAGADADIADIDSRHVAALWQQGDAAATAVMDEAIEALSAALAGVVHMLNPQAIVIGGGVAEIGKPFFERLRETTRRRTMPSLFGGVRIEPAVVGNRSGMIGAALQVWEYGGGDSV